MLVYVIGLFMGILSGLAIGGGSLLIPALVIFLNINQHTAQGISLASFIPTALVAVITHSKQGNVDRKVALYLILGSLVGAAIGSILANQTQAHFLRQLFGFFLISMGVYELLGKEHLPRKD